MKKPQDKRLRGFAAMDPQQQREIASQGGIASSSGDGHKFDQEEASKAAFKRWEIARAKQANQDPV